MEKIVWLREGKPCFLDEIENGVFYTVKAFRYLTNPGHSEYEYDWEKGKLVIGHDIVETHNRSVSMLIRCSGKGEEVLLEILDGCLKLAEVSSHDFVTLEHFGERLGKLVGKEGNVDLVEIRPRFFKKVKD
jgi:hypothetical protein